MAVGQGGVGRGVSRREVLRRGAVAGALAWAAPAVVSVPAHAQGADGTPECTCHPAAYGLRVVATGDVPVSQTFSHATGPNQDPDAVVDTDDDLDLEDSTGVRAHTVDSETGTCDANASAGSVTIDSSVLLGSGNPVITATVLQSWASADADGGRCDPSGGSSVGALTIDDTPHRITGDPNQTITVIPGMTIIVNERTTTCPDGREDLVVNALRVTLTVAGQLTLEVIVANSTVESCCDC